MSPWVRPGSAQHACHLPYATLGPDRHGWRFECDVCGVLYLVEVDVHGGAYFRRLDPEPGQRVEL